MSPTWILAGDAKYPVLVYCRVVGHKNVTSGQFWSDKEKSRGDARGVERGTRQLLNCAQSLVVFELILFIP